jgi:hypothetical protein
MLPRMDTFFELPALSNIGTDALDALKKRRLVVERGHHLMPPLPRAGS